MVDYTYTFSFDNLKHSNIINIKDISSKKYFLQLLSYSVSKDDEHYTINYKSTHLKVDRKYYLEAANITIDNFLRRDIIFALLGKRQFGANNNKYDFYLLDNDSDIGELLDEFNNSKYILENLIVDDFIDKNSCFKVRIFTLHEKHYVCLTQKYSTKRKKFYKNFIVELSFEDYSSLKNICDDKNIIEFIFSKIGFLQFQQIKNEHMHCMPNMKSLDESISKLINSNDKFLEDRSKLDNTKLYREIHEVYDDFKLNYTSLYSSMLNLLNSTTQDNIDKLIHSIIGFIKPLKDIESLQYIVAHLVSLQLFSENNKLKELFEQNDKDVNDIFLYMLDCFKKFSETLEYDISQIRDFNQACIDLQDSLKQLVDKFIIFHYEYSLKSC